MSEHPRHWIQAQSKSYLYKCRACGRSYSVGGDGRPAWETLMGAFVRPGLFKVDYDFTATHIHQCGPDSIGRADLIGATLHPYEHQETDRELAECTAKLDELIEDTKRVLDSPPPETHGQAGGGSLSQEATDG
jgi:hypothetical protein